MQAKKVRDDVPMSTRLYRLSPRTASQPTTPNPPSGGKQKPKRRAPLAASGYSCKVDSIRCNRSKSPPGSAAAAKEAAAAKLGVPEANITITVLEETKGLFGKSNVRVKAEVADAPAAKEAPAPKGKAKTAKAAPQS